MAIAKIVRMYTRRYRDSGQNTLYVEWRDVKGTTGRTECPEGRAYCNSHMQALVARGKREGVALEHEIW